MPADAGQLCRQVINADDSIRYVALVNKMGKIAASELRQGLSPILTEQERESYAMKAVLGKMGKEDFAYKLGPLLFTTAVFKKVKRVEVPLGGDEKGGDGWGMLIVSFDFQSDHEQIILKKVLPLIKQNLAEIDI